MKFSINLSGKTLYTFMRECGYAPAFAPRKPAAAGGGGLGDMLNAATGNVPHVEAVVAKFQQVSLRLRYAQVPTIAAVH